MEKIISFKRYICGYEEFDFSELYKGCSDGIKKLPVNVFLTEHKKFGTILINTGCSKTMRTNATSYSRLTSKRKLSFTDDDSIKARLLADKLDPVCIKKVLLTHCDPECCAGLKLLPRYEIISTAQVLSILWLADPSDGIISSTLPSAEIPRSAAGLFSGKSFLSDYFKWVFDVFGDLFHSSLMIVMTPANEKPGPLRFGLGKSGNSPYFCTVHQESPLRAANRACQTPRWQNDADVQSKKSVSWTSTISFVGPDCALQRSNVS